MINFDIFSRQNLSTSTTHKPSQGSCEMPKKFGPFTFTLIGYMQTNKHPGKEILILGKRRIGKSEKDLGC